MDDVLAFIQNRIRKLREEKGVSARDMSLSLGQNHSYINTVENGKATPSYDSLNYICQYFEISLSDFFDTSNPNPAMVKELLDETKNLERESLQLLIDMAKKLRQ